MFSKALFLGCRHEGVGPTTLRAPSSLASHEVVKRNVHHIETQLTGSLTLCSLEMDA